MVLTAALETTSLPQSTEKEPNLQARIAVWLQIPSAVGVLIATLV